MTSPHRLAGYRRLRSATPIRHIVKPREADSCLPQPGEVLQRTESFERYTNRLYTERPRRVEVSEIAPSALRRCHVYFPRMWGIVTSLCIGESGHSP